MKRPAYYPAFLEILKKAKRDKDGNPIVDLSQIKKGEPVRASRPATRNDARKRTKK